MDYGKAYRFFLCKPQTGLKNVLFGTVISLIPVIGPIIFLGHMLVMAEWLLEDEKRENYPDFLTDQFVDGLKLGLCPFVNFLICSFLIILPIYLILVGLVIGIGIAHDEPILIPIPLTLLSLLIGLMISYLIGPVLLYYQKHQKKLYIKGTFRFTLSFIKSHGFKYAVVMTITTLMNLLVNLVGLLFCFIGIYPASTISQIAYERMHIQIYDEYLALGEDRLPSVDFPRGLAFKPKFQPDPKSMAQELIDFDDSEFQ